MKTIVNNLSGKRVFVGLSGGVDSAVTAYLLKKAGAKVTGVFIQGWYPPNLKCTWASDRRDAMRVAAHIGIPFHTLDASAEYKKAVIDYLIREYKKGNTPNPDVMCNREVKFGAFFDFARAHDSDFIATGHYAKTRLTSEGVRLYKAVDTDKDQSYFLWAIGKEALAKTLFPLGGFRKEEVRRLAKKFNLPVALKKDSQGICFLGNVSMDDFLRSEIEITPGEAFDEHGTRVGAHDGSVLYTLGERIALADAPPGPWYVLAKDLQENRITVGKTRALEKGASSLKLTETSFFHEPKASVTAQYRYHGEHIEGRFDISSRTFTPSVPFSESIASGQSLVLYEGEECLGGGIIQ